MDEQSKHSTIPVIEEGRFEGLISFRELRQLLRLQHFGWYAPRIHSHNIFNLSTVIHPIVSICPRTPRTTMVSPVYESYK